jgi:hypothetical protein
MNRDIDTEMEDELRSEYDFSRLEGGVKGKYVERYRAGTNLVLLDPDVAQAFPTEDTVNEALRLLMQVAQRQPAKLLRSIHEYPHADRKSITTGLFLKRSKMADIMRVALLLKGVIVRGTLLKKHRTI